MRGRGIFIRFRKMNIKELIDTLKLQLHPEGGYFKETYRADGIIAKSALPKNFQGDRHYSTAIYYLLTAQDISRLHRLTSDEVWHFHLGGPLTLVEISSDGLVKKTILGPNVSAGEKLQYVVSAGNWFGAKPNSGTEFSLVGCTVAPGFDFEDFEMGDRETLLKEFPQAKEEINLLLP